MRWLAPVAAMALSAACQRSVTREMVEIGLTFDQPNTCRMVVNRESFTLPSDETEAKTALRRAAEKSPFASVRGNTSIPYKCFGASLLLAQEAGFQRVGFVAEPPPARE